jgi:ATP-dependent DNA helicase RecQ
MHYFNEKPLKQPHCCDCCGIDLSIYRNKSESRHSQEQLNWRNMLAQLLLGK